MCLEKIQQIIIMPFLVCRLCGISLLLSLSLLMAAMINFFPVDAINHQQQQHNRRRLQQDGQVMCNNRIVTSSPSKVQATSSAYGELFTVSSSNNNERLEIRSLGFYVDRVKLSTRDVTYEVWTRLGHYADPNRTNVGSGGIPLDATFDYRGNFQYWDRVAVGILNQFNLQQENYFQIPFERFINTIITGNEVRSFYVTLKEVGAMISAPLENWEDFGDKQLTKHCFDNNTDAWCQNSDSGDNQPILHIGEGVVSYPFVSVPYFYHPKKFMGAIYYVGDCDVTRYPTVAPTRTPSDRPSLALTTTPSVTSEPTVSPTVTASPTPRYFFEVDNKCYWHLSTDAQYELFRNETSSSYGMLLPLRSNEVDYDGLYITSLGFHVDHEALLSQNRQSVNYEVYVLITNGQYADTNRTAMKFDYRGDFSFWEKISHGIVAQNGDSDYFQIPFDNFAPTNIPPNGGVRSFYLTLDAPALVYKELDRRQGVGKTQKDDNYNFNRKRGDTPILMIGEAVISYPFIRADFLYNAKQFVGKIVQDYDCPSQSPSLRPSSMPSQRPTDKPSISIQPTQSPSWQPTFSPSNTPTTSLPPTHAPSDQPTSFPSTSLLPTSTIVPIPTSSPVQISSSSLTVELNYLVGCILIFASIV